MKKYLFIASIIILFSCKKDKSVESFVYSYNSQIVLLSTYNPVSNLKVYLVKLDQTL